MQHYVSGDTIRRAVRVLDSIVDNLQYNNIYVTDDEVYLRGEMMRIVGPIPWNVFVYMGGEDIEIIHSSYHEDIDDPWPLPRPRLEARITLTLEKV